METFYHILNWLTPAGLVTVVLTYMFSMRQRKFELRQEYYKRVRVTVSSLFMIWKDYSALEKFLKSNDESNLLLYKIPGGPIDYLKIDQDKIDRMTSAYNESIENLKEINTYLYYRLNDSLSHFRHTNEEIFEPLLHDEQIELYTKREVVTEVLDELLEELEEIIEEAIVYLPFRERRQMRSVMKKHLKSLKDESESEVPGYLVKLLNGKLPFKTTEEEIRLLYSNPTMIWLIDKAFSSQPFLKIMAEHRFGLKTIFNLSALEDSLFEKIGLTLLSSLQFTEEEQSRFIDNKAFYHQLMGLESKITGKCSFQTRRLWVSLNTGELTVGALLESMKGSIPQSE